MNDNITDFSLAKYRMGNSCMKGTPRDLLADLLDRIDNHGQLDKLDCIVVCMRESVDDETFTFFAHSSPDIATSLGTMEIAKQKMIGSID